jgi:hypothetical protein
MPVLESAVVDASDDAVDDSSFGDVIEVWSEADRAWHERILRAIKREDRWWRKHERDSEQMRAAHAARSTEIALREELEESGADLSWNSKRALDLQNFQYVFLHRERFDEQTCKWLEIVNAKITHVSKDGEDGYFKKLEQNIGWTQHITPIIFSHPSVTDKLVRCGIWSNAKNSRRCHQVEFCALCLWNDILKALVYAFGGHSGAFSKAVAWFFLTIGWTTNPANADCRCADYNPHNFHPHARDRGYDPYPVVLGLSDDDPDAAFLGYEDARTLGNVTPWAIAELYHREYINGYHSKREGEFSLQPGGANRVNFHDHTVSNGDEDNGQFIAEKLREFVNEGLAMFGRDLTQVYHPDIHVRKITSPEHLQHAICYDEKVVPVSHAVADALSRPEAKGADGFYDSRYIAKVKNSLARLIDDDIPAIFTGARLNEEQPPLFRRRTQGNMQFNDKGTCIGDEPDWHVLKRRKAAQNTRDSRERRKKRKEAREKEMCKADIPTPPRKKYPRRRKGSRRLPRVE